MKENLEPDFGRMITRSGEVTITIPIDIQVNENWNLDRDSMECIIEDELLKRGIINFDLKDYEIGE